MKAGVSGRFFLVVSGVEGRPPVSVGMSKGDAYREGVSFIVDRPGFSDVDLFFEIFRPLDSVAEFWPMFRLGRLLGPPMAAATGWLSLLIPVSLGAALLGRRARFVFPVATLAAAALLAAAVVLEAAGVRMIGGPWGGLGGILG